MKPPVPKLEFKYGFFIGKSGGKTMLWPWWPAGKAKAEPKAGEIERLLRPLWAWFCSSVLLSVLLGAYGAITHSYWLWTYPFFLACLVLQSILVWKTRRWRSLPVPFPGFRSVEEFFVRHLSVTLLLVVTVTWGTFFFTWLKDCYSDKNTSASWTLAGISLTFLLYTLRLLAKKTLPTQNFPSSPSYRVFWKCFLLSLGIWLVILCANEMAGAPFQLLVLNVNDFETWRQWGLQNGAYILSIFLLVGSLRFFGKKPDFLSSLGLRRPRWSEILLGAFLGTACFIALFLVNDGFAHLARSFGMVLWISLAAALVEEIWFRGFALPALSGPLGIYGGLFLTSLVFGLNHSSELTADDLRKGLLLGSVGLVSGLAFWRTKRLHASITTHAVYNLWVLTAALYIWLNPAQFPRTLSWAAKHLDAGRIETLVQKGAKLEVRDDVGSTPFLEAAREGHTDILRLLEKHGANHFAAMNTGVNALMLAACQEGEEDWDEADDRAVEYLLGLGLDVNGVSDSGMSALLYAADAGKYWNARALLKHGADPNLLNKYNHSALYLAAAGKHWDVMSLLLGSGAKPDLPKADIAATPLSLAVNNDNLEIVDLLLKHGADPNIVSDKGITIFQKAVLWNKPTMLRHLLSMTRKRPTAADLVKLERYAMARGGKEMAEIVRHPEKIPIPAATPEKNKK